MQTSEAIGSFLLTCQADGLKPRTVETYLHRLERFNKRFGTQEIATLTLKNIRDYSANLYKQGLSIHTIHGHLRTLRRFYKWLTEEELVEENLARRVRLPRLPENPPKAISMDNLRRLLKNAHENGAEWERRRNVAILLFLIDTGCRLNGLVELKLEDIDFEQRRAKVCEKNDRWRFVFLKEPVMKALLRWLEVRTTLLTDPEVTAVWIGRNGRALSKGGTQSLLKRLKNRAGLKGHTGAHSFRHRFAITYLLNGGDLATLANLLGHRDSETTTKYYARFEIGELQEKHDQFSPVNNLPTESITED